MTNEKNKIEALLFASAKRTHIEEISKITKIYDVDKVKTALNELRADYESRGTSIILNQDGDYWKLTIKDHYLPIMQKVVDHTELDRPLTETLAVIAWKYPVLQADVIKIRHNKAYDHLRKLEELGFIARNKFGRTNKITLTQKFFEYFDLPTKEQAKEVFKNVVPRNIKEKVEGKEKEIGEAEKKAEEMKRKIEEIEEQRRKEKESEKKIKEKIDKLEEEEEKELEEIKKDEKELDKEEKKDVYSQMPKVQEPNEVSGDEAGTEGKK